MRPYSSRHKKNALLVIDQTKRTSLSWKRIGRTALSFSPQLYDVTVPSGSPGCQRPIFTADLLTIVIHCRPTKKALHVSREHSDDYHRHYGAHILRVNSTSRCDSS